jgi:hypothetical protein
MRTEEKAQVKGEQILAAQEDLAGDLPEKVDETNYPGAPESPAIEVEGQESDQPTTEAKDTPAKRDWRVEKYGADWEKSADYWKDTASYWRDETKKRNKTNRIEETDETPAPRQSARAPAADDLSDQEVDIDSISSVKDLIKHIEAKQEKLFDEKLSTRQKQESFAQSMRAAREEYAGDPEAGIPSFTELEQEILIPMCEKQPQVLKLLKEMPDPKSAAYTLGMMLKLQGGFMNVLKGQGRAEVLNKIQDVTKQAVRTKGNSHGNRSSKATAADIWNMSSDEFEKQSARVIHGGK